MVKILAAWVLGGLGLAITGCSPTPESPDLTNIYKRVADASEGELRRPLITVPGILGSRLIDRNTGTVIWGGGSRGLSADPTDPEEARLIALPLLGAATPFTAQRDSVGAAGVLDTAEADVLGVKVELEVYGGIRRTLNAGGFRLGPTRDDEALYGADHKEGTIPAAAVLKDAENAFRFDYDWRRDLATLALDFHNFVMRRKELVAQDRSRRAGRRVPPEDITFDLLAHSMGGLVTRYYLMHGPAPLGDDGALPPVTWEGARHFSRVIMVATPNAGSILAMDNLVNGKDLGPFQPFFEAPLLGSHASTWQLMPRARHKRLKDVATGDLVDPYDWKVWEKHGWGMAAPSVEPLLSWLLPDIADPAARKARALTHQRRMLERAERFHEAMDRWGTPPDRLETFLVVGGGFRTPANAVLDQSTGSFTIIDEEEGDGVVLRASVLLDERQGGTYRAGLQSPLRFGTTLFLPDEHIELTRNPVFGDNLLFWLLEQPRDSEDLERPERTVLAAVAPTGPAPDQPFGGKIEAGSER